MGFSYNYGANPDIDIPRLLIADTVEFGPDGTTPVYIFDDREITAMATYVSPAIAIMPSGAGQLTTVGTPTYRYTAAALLDSLAANKARLANALKVLDITVNTADAARELRDTAQSLRDTEDSQGNFGVAEWTVDQFASRERLWKQMVRLQT